MTQFSSGSKRAIPFILAIAAMILVSAGPARAGKFNKVLSIGDSAPQWSDLQDTDGQPNHLSDWATTKVVALVFMANHCPIATKYEERLIQLQREFHRQGLQIIAVCVSRDDADKRDQVKVRAAEKGFNFLYLHDPSQKIGRDYGAMSTPHVFVMDADRRIAYMGAIDDNVDPPAVQKHYLRDAITALLEGKAPPVSESRPVGCEIQYASP